MNLTAVPMVQTTKIVACVVEKVRKNYSKFKNSLNLNFLGPYCCRNGADDPNCCGKFAFFNDFFIFKILNSQKTVEVAFGAA